MTMEVGLSSNASESPYYVPDVFRVLMTGQIA